MDIQQYLKNRHQFPQDELERHAGQYVAWSPDGTGILASEDDPGQVIEAVKVLGHDPGETVITYVPSVDETLLAGQVGGPQFRDMASKLLAGFHPRKSPPCANFLPVPASECPPGDPHHRRP